MVSAWDLGLLAATGVLAAVVAAVWAALRRVGHAQQQQAAAQRRLEQDLRALCNAAVSVGERINRMEQQAREVAARQEQLGVRQDRLDQVSGSQSYDQAIKMARKGASAEDLVEVCGLARGEAELITMMHRLSA